MPILATDETTGVPPRCMDGMFFSSPSTGWCYGTLFFFSENGTYENAVEDCYYNYGGANLPSINSEDENNAFVFVSHAILPVIITFWIGLECGENGQWRWANGETWNGYTNFKAGNGDPSHCDHNRQVRYIYNENKEWEEHTNQEAKWIICTKRADTIDTTTFHPTTTTTPEIGMPAWGIAAISVCTLLIIGVCIAIFIIVRRRFQSLRAEIVEVQIHSEKVLEEKEAETSRYITMSRKTDEWEIERRFVGLEYTIKLGEGAFGSVFLGRVLAKNLPTGVGRSIAELSALKDNSDTVAVKMLHETADVLADRDFRSEIELMKQIGYHERLVNMLACVTTSEPILLVSEYCSNGDLLEFMKQKRKYMLENSESTDDTQVITTKKQILFAIQIAYGMEYLSSRGFIHRDIAARNILVDRHETCKIGDFGLCRAVGKADENYHSQARSGGKLPLKWMPPEAIDNYHFSVASDVWSFGILLFEIVTLGGMPYADWPTSELLNRLKAGERMPQPDNCSEKLFDVMVGCWAKLPSERPIFAQLRKRLGLMLEEVHSDDYYLKLDPRANYYDQEHDDK